MYATSMGVMFLDGRKEVPPVEWQEEEVALLQVVLEELQDAEQVDRHVTEASNVVIVEVAL